MIVISSSITNLDEIQKFLRGRSEDVYLYVLYRKP